MTVEVESDGGYWLVRLNRPEKANALNAAMLSKLVAVMQEARDGAHALTLTGAGGVFSAGADLDEVRQGLATNPLWEELSGLVADLPCLTIAALNGALAGGAFGMVLACDLRIAVPSARFFYPVMQRGYLPQPSDPARLAALVGLSRAAMILMAGQKVGAEEALAWGLVDRLAEPDELLAVARELAGAVLAADRGHAGAIKEMLRGI